MQQDNQEQQTKLLPSGIPGVIPIALSVVGVILLYVWLSADAAVEFTERLPEQGVAEVLSGDGNVKELKGVG